MPAGQESRFYNSQGEYFSETGEDFRHVYTAATGLPLIKEMPASNQLAYTRDFSVRMTIV